MNISWNAPPYAVLQYTITASPLAYTNTFSAPSDLADFVLDQGAVGNTVGLGANALLLGFDAASWTGMTFGRGTAALAYRRIPDTTASYTTSIQVDVDCTAGMPAGATTSACGIVVFNAGTNMPVFTWTLTTTGGASVVMMDGYNASQSFPFSSGTTPWPVGGAGGVQLYLQRNTIPTTPFTVAARLLGDATPWASVLARTTVGPSVLNSFAPAALWYGVVGKAQGGTSGGPLGTASFANFLLSATIPVTAPKDVYGNADVCIAPGPIQPVSQTVGPIFAWVVLSGLSANYPYTVTVVAEQDTGVGPYPTSLPSAPVPGTYFWARNAPPRAQHLALWLDSKWIASGAVSSWPDASGNGHTMTGTGTTRPTSYRGSGYGSDFLQPGLVRFTRTSATQMVSDSDALDLGVSHNMTIYWIALNRNTETQVFMGRGTMATNLDYSPGWVLAASSTPVDTTTGFLSLRVSDSAGTVAAAQVTNIISSTSGYQIATPLVALVRGASGLPTVTGPLGTLEVVACNEPTCTAGSPGPFLDPNNPTYPNNVQFGAPVDVQYVDDGLGAFLPNPLPSPDSSFRIGGSVVTGGNKAVSYGGDVYGVMIYREAHDAATRQSITNWYLQYTEVNYCPLDITSPGLGANWPALNSYNAAQCRTGPIWANCYQACTVSGYSQFLGVTQYHSCSLGAWNAAPLICKRRCYDVPPPIYIASCMRRYIEEDFNLAAAGWLQAKYTPFPAMPIFERLTIWSIDTVNNWMQASTTTADACARIRTGYSILGPANAMFSLYNPPHNLLQSWTQVSVWFNDGTSTAGVVTRLQDENNHYRAEFSANNITLKRVWASKTYVIGFISNYTFAPGQWYTIGVRATNLLIEATIGGVSVLRVTEPTMYQAWGSGGMYIGPLSSALFDDLTIDIQCDMGNEALYIFEGMKIMYTCLPGYITIGNTTQTCVDNVKQYNGSSLTCLSLPPTPMPFNVSILERTPNNTIIGTVIAQPANSQQTISYSMYRQYPPPPNGTFAFSISGCSGAIRVFDPPQLNWSTTTEFTLTLFAWPDSQTMAGVYFNVTINMINIPDPPLMADTSSLVNEGLCGPQWSIMLPFVNPDRWTLQFSIQSGNALAQFVLDPVTSMLNISCAVQMCPGSVPPGYCPTGLNTAYATQWQLIVSAVGLGAPPGMSSIGNLNINVMNVNTKPILPPSVMQIREDHAARSAFIGNILCIDLDAANTTSPWDPVPNPPSWYLLSFVLTSNPSWTSLSGAPTYANVLSVNSAGSVSFSATTVPVTGFAFNAVADYTTYSGAPARAVLQGQITCTDGGLLSASNTLTVVITPQNSSIFFSAIQQVSLPPGGLGTAGGDLITFTGSGFPTGSAMTMTYGASYTAINCIIVASTVATCRSVPGYGEYLPFSVTMAYESVNATPGLSISYAAPSVSSISIAGLVTTAGSSNGAVTISGSNFGPLGTPATIYVGPNWEFGMTVSSVNQNTIVATLGPGCGLNLPVTVVIGLQNSTVAGSDLVSYPQATITGNLVSAGLGYTLYTFSTLGGQYLRLIGTNFGPATILGQPAPKTVTYTDGSGAYSYTIQCTNLVGSSDFDLECNMAPGVGAFLTFTANVCGQLSQPSTFTANYSIPVVNVVSGAGASRATTEGGQQVIITGLNFGPLSTLMPNSITSVGYGKAGRAPFAPTGCAVTIAGAQITCTTAPGTGVGVGWQVVIGAQVSNVDFGTGTYGYGAPIISFFTGPGALLADTMAGPNYNVTVNGLNFGFDISLLNASYSEALQLVRFDDGLLPSTPGNAPGLVTFLPVECDMVVPHRELVCTMPPGAGANLVWTLFVDEQRSTAPTTNFAPPVINSVVLTLGGQFASSDGGDLVDIYGSDLGPCFTVQSITYGPTGHEFKIKSWTCVDHTHIQATLVSGVGANLAFVITVADQVSLVAPTSLSYILPTILSVAPATGPATYDAARPTLVTVTGYDFGILNPNVMLEVAFGNYNDSDVVRVPILSRDPSLAQVSDPLWLAPPPPVLYTVTFNLPPSLGMNRTVRIVQSLTTSVLSDAAVALLPAQAASPATYTYNAPYITFVAISSVDAPTCALYTPLFQSSALLAAVNCSSMRVLELNGVSFGPSATVTGDRVVRDLQYQVTFPVPGWWGLPGQFAIAPINWTDTQITAVSVFSTGTMRLAITSHLFDGTPQVQLSNVVTYSTVSPQVLGVFGQPFGGFRTEGYVQLINNGEVPQTLSITVAELNSFATLTIQIGTPPFALSNNNCPIVDSNGNIVPPGQVYAELVEPVTGGGSGPVTLTCLVPAGQGTDQPVQVWKNNLVPSENTFTVAYAAASISALGTYITSPVVGYLWSPLPPATTLVSPTHGGFVGFQGQSFGPCPSVLFNLETGPVYVDYCEASVDAESNPILLHNPAVTVTYDSPSRTYTLTVPVPDGEGVGWVMRVAGFDLLSTNAALLNYMAPTVLSISPNAGPPAGSTDANPILLSINGVNFGSGTSNISVSLVSPYRASPIPCPGLRRLSDTLITCNLPAGTGWVMSAMVVIGGQTGVGGSFNYTPPVVNRITLLDPDKYTPPGQSAIPASLWDTLVVAPGTPNSITPAAGVITPPLQWYASGGAVAVVDGLNFGPAGVDNCAVLTDPNAMATLTWRCDGMETYAGEGEVPPAQVLFWNDTRAVFLTNPGAGVRTLMVTPGGQPPATALQRAVNYVYYPPALVGGIRPRAPISTLGGTLVDLWGTSLPLPVYNTFLSAANASHRNFSFPLPLPLPGYSALQSPQQWYRFEYMLPTENVQLVFQNGTSSNMPCLGSPYTPDGNLYAPPGFGGCLNSNIARQQSVNAPNNLVGYDVLTFAAPPGVGVNKTLQLSIVAANGAVVASTASVLFSYAPPVIDNVTTSGNSATVYDNGAGGESVQIRGANFGSQADLQYMTPQEQVITLLIGGFTPASPVTPSRLSSPTTGDYVGFLLPPGAPAGYSVLDLRIAGQWGYSTPRSASSLFVGCSPNFFAHAGEACTACPVGANCSGFITALFTTLLGADEFSWNVSAVPPALHPWGFPMNTLFNTTVTPTVTYNGVPTALDIQVDLTGYHTYPVPQAGFYNLNGSMLSGCPADVSSMYPNRDVCIVACMPASACAGLNYCAPSYQSLAPLYRCSSCNAGYYRSASDCIKCPDSPGMLFVGFALLLLAVAGLGYFLNKYQFDIRVVSIGIDFLQVLAIFANAGVKWPAVILQLYSLLAAFNLNIEIVAPECLVPNVTFSQKFTAILLMPFLVLTMFGVINGSRFLFYRFVYKQRNWRDHLRNMASSISILLVLMFLLYLYVTRTILTVWDCVPAPVDDGGYYIVEAAEICTEVGGAYAYAPLVGPAVIGLLCICMGYPVFVGSMLLWHRETVMEDQLLLALGMAPPKGSWASLLRAMMGRTYYQFKPAYSYFWILVVISRKFFIALVSLLLRRNAAFQMATCLLILFVSYAAQVRYRPYMPASEFADVLEHAARMAKKSALYSRLKARLINVESQAKKAASKNTLSDGPISVTVVAGKIYLWLMNYNTLEAFLLFAATLVCLMGVMYEALASGAASGYDPAYYTGTINSITFFLMLLISVSITYYVTVLCMDIGAQYKARREAWYKEEALKKKNGKTAKKRLSKQGSRANMDLFRDDADRKAGEQNVTNPLFMSAAGSEATRDAVTEAIVGQLEPPTATLWNLFRENYTQMTTQVSELTDQLTIRNNELRRMGTAMQDAGMVDADGNIIVQKAAAASSRPAVPGRSAAARREFGPQQSAATPPTSQLRVARPSGTAGGAGATSPVLSDGEGTPGSPRMAGFGAGGEVEMAPLATVGTAADSRERTLVTMSSFRRLNNAPGSSSSPAVAAPSSPAAFVPKKPSFRAAPKSFDSAPPVRKQQTPLRVDRGGVGSIPEGGEGPPPPPAASHGGL